ncbi:hypothetical protein ACHMW6_15540 [Pseudoduganella sp. UC29_106]|uniref:hypothetical protein n=1 Tax=Pseudoduganella sp. UC29_106 TaxID=3374553 RepID=UPI003757EB87
MNTNSYGVTPSYGLLRAAEAVTNWRALAATGLAGMAILLSVFLTGALAKASMILGALGVLFTFVVVLTGYSAVGILLMRQAQQQPIGIPDAFIQAIFTVHRLLGVAAMMFLCVLGVSLFAVLILLCCKLPGVGSLLYAVASPVLTVLIGATIAGLLYVALPLAAPAVWEGNTVWQTTARLLVIVRQRLVSVIINLVILSLLVLVLAGVVYVVLSSGYLTTAGLSSAVGIDSIGGLSQSLTGMMMSGLGSGGGFHGGESQSYAGAFIFSTGVLVMIGAIIPALTYINGTCLVYLQTVEGLNFGEAEEQIQTRMEEARRVAREAKERANAQMQQAKAAAQRPEAAAEQRSCTVCKAPMAADDVFCGECGAKHA